MNKSIYLIFFSMIFGCFSAFAEQTCVQSPSVPPTTPSDRFTINTNGTALDNETGLMWQICDFGQNYDSTSSTCSSAALQLNWQQALTAAKNSDYAGFSDWHVPNVKELASILEHSCVEPAINLQVFISTQSDNYWTSTTAVSQIDHAWAYQFSDGKNNLKAKTSDIFLRLVRYAK